MKWGFPKTISKHVDAGPAAGIQSVSPKGPHGLQYQRHPQHYDVLKCFLVILFLLSGCGHSQFYSLDTRDTAAPAGSAAASAFSLSLGSDFPADIDIPDIDGMRSTAFVISTSNPAAVLAIDLDARPLKLSSKYKGIVNPPGSGIPNNLVITAQDEAFLLTSSSVVAFNPFTGIHYSITPLLKPLNIGLGYRNSEGNPPPETITPSFPGGIAVVGRKLFVSSSNYTRTAKPAIANPGTIQVFEINADRTLTKIGHFVTSCFNPTALTVRKNRELLITNSGVLDIVDAGGSPTSDSCIDIIDVETMRSTTTISLGRAGASFHPIALTPDGSVGFLGSSSFGYLYQIDLINRRVIRGIDDPIVITTASDYITDVELSVDGATLFATSFEASAAYTIDISKVPPEVETTPIVVGFATGVTDENPSGANTGAGPMAIRPGTRGEDYEETDLIVLTGYPGRMLAINSQKPASVPALIAPTTPTDDEELPPPPTGDPLESCQGYAQSVYDFNPGPDAGFGQGPDQDAFLTLGPPRGTGALSASLHVVSLGDHGDITLDMGNCHIIDGEGIDFIVFENPFFIGGDPLSPYRELGAVGVSNDGTNFTEFSCLETSYPYTGCAGWNPVYSHPNNTISPFDQNVAGGEAFDLADLGVNRVRYIRIRDLHGGGESNKHGFDLDAIAIVHGEIHY